MNSLLDLFSDSFFQRALLASALISIICGFIGSWVVAKRITFIAGGVSHASFGGIGFGYWAGFPPVLSAAVFGLFAALTVQWFQKKDNLRSDATIGIIWAAGMALGILFLAMTPGYTPNLMSYLFGNILTVSTVDLLLMAGVAAVVVLFFTFYMRTILYISYDEEFARVQQLPVDLFNYLLIGLTALSVVVAIRAVGIILVISLLTIPQTIINLFSHRFRRIAFFSTLLSFIAAFSGLLAAAWLNIPTGATIILTLVVFFAVARVFYACRTRRLKIKS